MRRWLSFALLLLAGLACADGARAESGAVQVAQAQPAAQAPAAQAPAAAPAQAADAQQAEEPIGNVATLSGKASVTRNDKQIPLALKDDIYLNDVVQTSANSALGITFSDGTTFNLKASSQITIDDFVYEEGGKKNSGLFDVAKGTVAFVAAQVAKTGNMQITTPTATLGIRGTSGLVEVPAGTTAASPANNVNIKLYPDADGRVGRIEVNDRAGARLGFLSQGASGFTIRPGIGGARFAAVPIAITPQMMQRDQGFVRLAHSTQTLGRRVFDEQRAFRRANPTFVNPNRPIRQPGQQPGQFRRNGQPGQPQQPGLQDRRGRQQPGAPGRQGLQQPGSPQQSGQPPRAGQPSRLGQPNRQPGQPGQQTGQQPGGPPRPGLPPRPGQTPGTPGQVGSPAGAPQQGAPIAGQPRPGGPAGTPPLNQPRFQQPGGPQPLPQQGGQFRQPGAPALQQPGLTGRPALQLPRRTPPVQAPPKGKKPPNSLR
ncbi:FecR domain-containing protein [Bradyrhizobium sp.]|uniref:FecR family protein n=1 Tax=Bradyrhizobium sp. TaxID=376 RepID=UPI001D9B7EB0|nr:FecR domain-containing protein [Bradyrhizobium sp.]MBI5322252.1 FecR domain-containing protein [Bradyrhizobium sp.]